MSKAKPIEQAEAEAGAVVDNVVDLRKRTPAERRDSAIAYVKEHSGVAIAGAVVVGILVALLLPRRRRKPAKRASALVDAIGATAAMLGREALDRAGSAGSDLRRGGDRAAHRSEELGIAIAKQAGAFLHSFANRAESVGEVAADQAGKVTKLAAKRLDKAGSAVEDAAVTAAHHIGKSVSEARSKIIG